MTTSKRITDLELWGGIECTVNRVGNDYFDQLARSGHASRIEDLDLFAALGLRTLRYPILWERVAPDGLERADWSWADERLGRLRQLGIRPIVGLCHHGSGPHHTSLVDPAFPDLLADFAAAVAERYPWVDAYTPVNEPLTTARFAALYGHWYPHHRDERSFIQALVGQCAAVARAMERIRRVNPEAQLIQTEDLGKTFSTPELAYQADFDNDRRWLTFDLLCGRVDHHHPLWNHLVNHGQDERLLDAFLDQPCPPDVLGLNYYLTGERFLDHRIDHYPPHLHGGNGYQAYADVEAVRVLEAGIAGPVPLLREVWERYARPIAVTEAHLGCTREEQVRWLAEVWSAAGTLKRDGIDIRAVTVWSLLGAFDWNSLLTRQDDFYEPGVFDVRGPAPRPTALAGVVANIISDRHPNHPVAHHPGWWRRQTRLLYPAVSHELLSTGDGPTAAASTTPSALLILGLNGWLEQALADDCATRGIPYQLMHLSEATMTDQASLESMLRQRRVWAVINTTTCERFDLAGHDLQPGGQLGIEGATALAAACAQLGIRLLTFTTDQVFDGAKHAPYVESDPIAPRNIHGEVQAAMEQEILAIQPDALVIRTSAVFGRLGIESFVPRVEDVIKRLPAGSAPQVTTSLTYAPDLVDASLDFLIDGERGLLHLSNTGAVTWESIVDYLRDRAGIDVRRNVPSRKGRRGRLRVVESRPELGSERAWVLPPLPDALSRYLRTG